MANEIQAARDKVKGKLDIDSSNTDFDTIITDALEEAVRRLAPWVQYKIAEDTSVTLAAGDDSFTMPVSGSTLLRLYMRSTTVDEWQEYDLWRTHRDTVYLLNRIETAKTVKILASRPYGYTDADFALLETDYPQAMLPLYLFAMSEFATNLVGNKRKFNIYQQANGSRSLSEMQELSDWYDQRAIRILEDEVSAEGQ